MTICSSSHLTCQLSEKPKLSRILPINAHNQSIKISHKKHSMLILDTYFFTPEQNCVKIPPLFIEKKISQQNKTIFTQTLNILILTVLLTEVWSAKISVTAGPVCYTKFNNNNYSIFSPIFQFQTLKLISFNERLSKTCIILISSDIQFYNKLNFTTNPFLQQTHLSPYPLSSVMISAYHLYTKITTIQIDTTPHPHDIFLTQCARSILPTTVPSTCCVSQWHQQNRC